MQLIDAFEDYMHNIEVVEAKSHATVSAYQSDLHMYLTYLVSHDIDRIEQIDYQHIEAFIISLKKTKASTSVNRMITSIRMFHRYLSLSYPDVIDPTLHLHSLKTKQQLPRYFNVNDITKLLDSFDQSDLGLFHKALLEVLYGCGLRVSELVSLRLNDCHLQQGYLKVLGKGNKERMVPMHQRSVEALQAYLRFVRCQWVKKKSSFVFLNAHGNVVTRQYVHELIKTKLHELNLDERLSAHSFRHSFATHLLDGGANLRVVQELLGHATISTTQIYTHVQNERLKQAYLKSHPRSKKEDES